MSIFCLVHGAFQGAWVWDLLIPHLQAQGHTIVTMDLPIEDSSVNLLEFATIVSQTLPKTNDDIILVGHSMAGTIIPLVAEIHKIRQLVFLAALIPYPGKSTIDQFAHNFDSDTLKSFNYERQNTDEFKQFDDEPNMFHPLSLGRDFSDVGVLKEIFYNDCSPEVVEMALSKRRLQQSMAYIFEVNPLQSLPNVEYKYIVCNNDKIISPEWSKYAARKRLGIDPIELPGGHCPHLSYPEQLAKILTDTVD